MQVTQEKIRQRRFQDMAIVKHPSCPVIRPELIPTFEIPRRSNSAKKTSSQVYQRHRAESLSISSKDWITLRSGLRRRNTLSAIKHIESGLSDPGYDLSLTLRHAPVATTSYGFPRIVISPTTTRKESLFYDGIRPNQTQLAMKSRSLPIAGDPEQWPCLTRARCDSGISDSSDFTIPNTPKSRTSTFSSISENEESSQEIATLSFPQSQRKFSCFAEDSHLDDWGYSSESSSPQEGGSPNVTHRRFSAADTVMRGTRQRTNNHATEDIERQELLKQLHALCVKQNAKNCRDLGEIEYWLKYDFDSESLKVLVLRAENVGSTTSREKVNTFVKITLVTDSVISQQTKVIKHTRDPIYDQEVTFPLKPVDVHVASLRVIVYRQRKVTKVLGGPVFLGMAKESSLGFLLSSSTKRIRKDLQAEDTVDKDSARVNLSICYKPRRRILEITVVKVGNLPRSTVIGLPDTEVRVDVSQISGGEVKTMTFKTKTKRWNSNPVFKEAFSFPVTNVQNLRDGLSVTCTVIGQNHLRKNKCFGKIGLGLTATQSSEHQQWKDVLANPGYPCNRWHKLVEGK